MSLEALRLKEEKENEGKWEPFGPPLGGEGLICHHQNPGYRKRLSAYIDQLRKRYKGRRDWTLEEMTAAEGDAAELKLREIMIGTTFKAIRGVEKSPGVPLESTPENLLAILQTRDGFEFVDRVSKSMRAEIEEDIEDASKNSVPSSAGASAVAVSSRAS